MKEPEKNDLVKIIKSLDYINYLENHKISPSKMNPLKEALSSGVKITDDAIMAALDTHNKEALRLLILYGATFTEKHLNYLKDSILRSEHLEELFETYLFLKNYIETSTFPQEKQASEFFYTLHNDKTSLFSRVPLELINKIPKSPLNMINAEGETEKLSSEKKAPESKIYRRQ